MVEALIKRPLPGNPSFSGDNKLNLVRKYKGKDAAAQFISQLHNIDGGKECKFVKKKPDAAVDVDVGILVDGCGSKGVCDRYQDTSHIWRYAS